MWSPENGYSSTSSRLMGLLSATRLAGFFAASHSGQAWIIQRHSALSSSLPRLGRCFLWLSPAHGLFTSLMSTTPFFMALSQRRFIAPSHRVLRIPLIKTLCADSIILSTTSSRRLELGTADLPRISSTLGLLKPSQIHPCSSIIAELTPFTSCYMLTILF